MENCTSVARGAECGPEVVRRQPLPPVVVGLGVTGRPARGVDAPDAAVLATAPESEGGRGDKHHDEDGDLGQHDR